MKLTDASKADEGYKKISSGSQFPLFTLSIKRAVKENCGSQGKTGRTQEFDRIACILMQKGKSRIPNETKD